MRGVFEHDSCYNYALIGVQAPHWQDSLIRDMNNWQRHERVVKLCKQYDTVEEVI